MMMLKAELLSYMYRAATGLFEIATGNRLGLVSWNESLSGEREGELG